MPQYNLFQAIYMSFYSRSLYKDVANNWGAKSFLYLLILLSLTWVVSIYQAQQAISSGYATMSETLVAQVPVMTITDGKLKTPENRPYIISDPNSKEALVVIDTSGKYTSLEQINTNVLITPTRIYSKPKENQQRIDEIPAKLNLVVAPDVVNGYIKRFVSFFWIPFFLFAVLFSYLYRIFQALVYSILGKLMAMVMGVKLSYWQILQIMMVAITPVLLICTVLHALSLDLIRHNLVYFLLAMGYLAFGIRANK